MKSEADNRKRKIRKSALIGGLVAVGMFGFGYLLIPFYSVLCNTLGINGKTKNEAIVASGEIDKERIITVEFLSTNNESLPWQFYPKQTKIKLHPGEVRYATYYAKNDTENDMVVQAIPSVTPGIAAAYLQKTECFCFTHQPLAAGESAELPLLFHLDPNLPKDIKTITLSYTLFDVTNKKINNRKPAGRIS